LAPCLKGIQGVKKSRFIEEQIAYALKQVEVGIAVSEISRKPGVVDVMTLRLLHCSDR